MNEEALWKRQSGSHHESCNHRVGMWPWTVLFGATESNPLKSPLKGHCTQPPVRHLGPAFCCDLVSCFQFSESSCKIWKRFMTCSPFCKATWQGSLTQGLSPALTASSPWTGALRTVSWSLSAMQGACGRCFSRHGLIICPCSTDGALLASCFHPASRTNDLNFCWFTLLPEYFLASRAFPPPGWLSHQPLALPPSPPCLRSSEASPWPQSSWTLL